MRPGTLTRVYDRATATRGIGHSRGEDGSDGAETSVRDAEGNVLVSAPGGLGGHTGTGVRLETDALNVSALMLVSHFDTREGLAFLSGGAWQDLYVLNLPYRTTLAPYMVFEASGVTEGEYTITVDANNENGEAKGRISFPLTVERTGDILRIPRGCLLPVEIDSYGLWRVVVATTRGQLAAIDLMVDRFPNPAVSET